MGRSRVEASRSTVIEASESLEQVVGRIGPIVKGIVSEIRQSAEWPDEVEVEFAVKISADSNLVIARAGGEANFRIALRWGEHPRVRLWPSASTTTSSCASTAMPTGPTGCWRWRPTDVPPAARSHLR